jgi:hypothetical protein
MITVKKAKNGELYYATKARNNKSTGGGGETFKTKAGIRTNIRANLKFWGGSQMLVRWPDGTNELIYLTRTALASGCKTVAFS